MESGFQNQNPILIFPRFGSVSGFGENFRFGFGSVRFGKIRVRSITIGHCKIFLLHLPLSGYGSVVLLLMPTAVAAFFASLLFPSAIHKILKQ